MNYIITKKDDIYFISNTIHLKIEYLIKKKSSQKKTHSTF